MSAVPSESRHLLPMSVAQLDVVMAIEAAAYAFPWSRGNFVDSLVAGYPARVLYADDGEMLGYFVAMLGVDEMHLLNITVAARHESRGHARFMLDELVQVCRECAAASLWLEVRESNTRAQSIYRRFGFRRIGLRKGYYPAPRSQREDAIVMSLAIAAASREAGDALV